MDLDVDPNGAEVGIVGFGGMMVKAQVTAMEKVKVGQLFRQTDRQTDRKEGTSAAVMERQKEVD